MRKKKESDSFWLSEENKILCKIIPLCLEPLPKNFAGYEANNRIWKAFHLGREYQKSKGNK